MYLYELLDTNSYNLEEIKKFLTNDGSSINTTDILGRTPLLKVLENSNKCSLELVKLLLQYGSDVNKRHFGKTPLIAALEYTRDEAIIEALLNKGANIEDHHLGRSPLRYTFSNWNGENSPEKFNWKENVLHLLLKAGVDLNKVSANGKSPLCFVLWEGADGRDIELLLNNGCRLSACLKHASPLHCVTDITPATLLKASAVKVILERQALEGKVFENSLQPLQCALRWRYETAAIKLLLEHLDGKAVNTWIQQSSEALHWVVDNKYCKTSTVKLFLKRGVCVDKLNSNRETVLHTFMKSNRRDLNFIELLLKSGAPVNSKDKLGETPLRRAINQGMGNYVINLLLAFGARFGISCNRNGISLLEIALARFGSNYEKEICVFKTLVKYYFLEFPGMNIQRLIRSNIFYTSLSVFAVKCADELKRMELRNVRPDCTLRRFISENFLLDVKTDQEIKVANEDCNQLLKIVSGNEFPEYFDVIASKILASKVGKVFLKENVHQLIMYTVEHCPAKACLIKKVVLNNDCVRKLAQFLSDDELLRLIVAFYQSSDLACNNNTSKKRDLDSKQFTNFEKQKKLN